MYVSFFLKTTVFLVLYFEGVIVLFPACLLYMYIVVNDVYLIFAKKEIFAASTRAKNEI